MCCWHACQTCGHQREKDPEHAKEWQPGVKLALSALDLGEFNLIL
jgi:hypothetical protein